MKVLRNKSVLGGMLSSLTIQALFPVLGSTQSMFGIRENPESFRIELMGSDWTVHPGGQIQANGTPVDFVNDLNVGQHNSTFFGQVVIKPGRRHRIIAEGTPFQIGGANAISRSIVYRGRTFNVNETVASAATLNYLFAGYQYDVLTGSKGHLGFNVGAAYLDATGTLEARTTSAVANTSETATKNQKLALPLAGVDFRVFPIPGRNILEIEGGIRGMKFGDYGYYAQAIAQGGVCLGPFTALAGYRAVNTAIYVTANGSSSGITARLKGPIFSGSFRW